MHSSQSSISFSMFGASISLCLTASPTPTLFGVFAFHHRRSHPLNLVLLQQLIFLSLHALERSSLVAFLKSTKDFLLYNFFHTVSALSFIWELFFSLHLLSHYSTSLDPSGTPAQSSCALVQFWFSRFLPILCFYV